MKFEVFSNERWFAWVFPFAMMECSYTTGLDGMLKNKHSNVTFFSNHD